MIQISIDFNFFKMREDIYVLFSMSTLLRRWMGITESHAVLAWYV